MKNTFISFVSIGVLTLTAAVPAFAADAMTTALPSRTATVRQQAGLSRRNLQTSKTEKAMTRQSSSAKQALDGVAIAALVSTREDAIIAAHKTAFASWEVARTTLKTSLVAAWTAKDITARKTAWDVFNKAVRALSQTKREAVKAAHKAYVDGVKLSGATSADISAASVEVSSEVDGI
ncbi:MAG: hypothetical protein KBD00_00190 [Candidatus Peribacteraceae bacterium]|nr:hypothetical protein [Candidatus Peribacteraceae bacterium]